MPITESARLGPLELQVETGDVARQAGGSVLLHCADTVLLATATAARERTRLSYMPLTTDYRLRYSSAGRIPGTHERREARPNDHETLTSRLIDRSIRPFFPGGWAHDTQVLIQPLSHGAGSDHGVLGILAASCALVLSDVPWEGPVAAVRVGLAGDGVELMPAAGGEAARRLDLVVTVGRGGLVMVEGGGDEVPEDSILEAFAAAREAVGGLLDLQERLLEHARPKRSTTPRESVEAGGESGGDREELSGLSGRARELAGPRVAEALAKGDKLERHAALARAADEVAAELGDSPEARDAAVGAVSALEKEGIRRGILEGRRIGGRGPEDVREITGRAGWLPRCHGSSLFTRGETQAIVTCTLGTLRDARWVDMLEGRVTERFILHYNFPPYCVGEVRPLRGPGRREIGHGLLARRALLPVLPSQEDYPHAIRIESLVTESNGSSSMATTCGGTLALLDAGVPLRRPVAGIAMGLVQEGDDFVVLSDILGDEDHVGDMDFKVCGTEEGVTAIQLDNKIGALPDEVMERALRQARLGRQAILASMAEVLGEPRRSPAAHVPRVATVRVDRNRIGSLIGPGGRNIQAVQAEHDVKVDVDDEGVVRIWGDGADAVARAELRVKDLTGVPRLGEVHDGVVVGAKPFGCFVRLFEGIEALLPEARLEVGARVAVRVTGVDDRGRIGLEKA